MSVGVLERTQEQTEELIQGAVAEQQRQVEVEQGQEALPMTELRESYRAPLLTFRVNPNLPTDEDPKLGKIKGYNGSAPIPYNGGFVVLIRAEFAKDESGSRIFVRKWPTNPTIRPDDDPSNDGGYVIDLDPLDEGEDARVVNELLEEGAKEQKDKKGKQDPSAWVVRQTGEDGSSEDVIYESYVDVWRNSQGAHEWKTIITKGTTPFNQKKVCEVLQQKDVFGIPLKDGRLLMVLRPRDPENGNLGKIAIKMLPNAEALEDEDLTFDDAVVVEGLGKNGKEWVGAKSGTDVTEGEPEPGQIRPVVTVDLDGGHIAGWHNPANDRQQKGVEKEGDHKGELRHYDGMDPRLTITTDEKTGLIIEKIHIDGVTIVVQAEDARLGGEPKEDPLAGVSFLAGAVPQDARVLKGVGGKHYLGAYGDNDLRYFICDEKPVGGYDDEQVRAEHEQRRRDAAAIAAGVAICQQEAVMQYAEA